MKTVKFKEILNVDNVSQEKSWMKVYDKLKDINEDIEINFDDVNVLEPWRFKAFQMILSNNPHVYMSFTNKDDIVSKLHMSCIINGVDKNRIIGRHVEVEKPKTPEELKAEKRGREITQHFKLDDQGVYRIKVSELYAQLHNSSTITYICKAIEMLNQEKEITQFIIDIGDMSVQLNVLKHLAEKVIDYTYKGISIAIDTSDEETAKNIRLFLHQCRNDAYNDKVKRYDKIISSIKKDTPGLFLRYKSSKALDDFGRHGSGQVVSSRIAIFREIRFIAPTRITTKDDLRDAKIMCVIDTYNSDYFYTKLHWSMEHDNETLKRIPMDTYKVDIEELGFCDDFLGSKYHFMLPIQQSENENTSMIVGLNNEGKNIRKVCTIPERMKLVFDDWGIDYDKVSLNQSIKLTEQALNNNKQK